VGGRHAPPPPHPPHPRGWVVMVVAGLWWLLRVCHALTVKVAGLQSPGERGRLTDLSVPTHFAQDSY